MNNESEEICGGYLFWTSNLIDENDIFSVVSVSNDLASNSCFTVFLWGLIRWLCIHVYDKQA